MCSFHKSSSKCPSWKCVKFSGGALAAQSPLFTLAVRAWVYVSNCFFLPILSVMPCVLLPNFLVTKHLFQCYWLWREHPHHDLLHRCSLSFSPPSTLLQWTEAVEKNSLWPCLLSTPHNWWPRNGVLIQPIRTERLQPVQLLCRVDISSWWMTFCQAD